jgi:hypothetical protein
MEKIDELSMKITDEIMSAPEQFRADLALQVASSFVEYCGYEMARSGVVKSSTRLFLIAEELERLRKAELTAQTETAPDNIVPFVRRAAAGGGMATASIS